LLIREDATEKLKTVKEFPELNMYNPNIDTHQISKIAGNLWNKLPESEKAPYKNAI
ncbi:24864_t:CDS:2, partial [Gigaspora margarita]